MSIIQYVNVTYDYKFQQQAVNVKTTRSLGFSCFLMDRKAGILRSDANGAEESISKAVKMRFEMLATLSFDVSVMHHDDGQQICDLQ